MPDNRTREQRSYNMSRIRSKNTKPEILVRKYLFSNGFRYRLHDKKLPGKPDIILRKYKTIIFIHGCFFHGHVDCKYAKKPVTNAEFWKDKIVKNFNRDINNKEALRLLGWNVVTVWECDLEKKTSEFTLKELIEIIKTNRK